MMDWFAKSASAIQAIASVVGVLITGVLAYITWRYVKITREIAESSAEQVRQFKESTQVAKQQTARSLSSLALRTRTSLGAGILSSDAPQHGQLRAFSQVTTGDISDIESLAKNLNDSQVSTAAAKAVAAIRDVLWFVETTKDIHPSMGWIPTQAEIIRWRRALEESERSLHFIQDECEKLASS